MSSNCKFFNYHQYDEKKIQLKRPIIREINYEKYLFVPLRYRNREIYVKTPKIIVPFGLNIYTTEVNEKYYYYVLSFTDIDIDPNIEKFYQFLRKIENCCQNIVKENLGKWGCEYSFEKLNFKSCFKESDGTPLFRLKITHTGKQLTELYDEGGKLQKIEDVESYVTKHCQVISLIELNNIWVNSTEYGVTWKVHQMRVYPTTKPIGGVSLLDENIEVHTVKIINKEQSIVSDDTEGVVPIAPPPPSFDEPKVPFGGLAILPFLSSITDGGFKLRKVDPNEVNQRVATKDKNPKISLAEILQIRNKLKSTSNVKPIDK